MKVHFVESFGPASWLKFPNDFKEWSFLWKKMGPLSFPAGLSNLGMCGGLASTALDLFYSHRHPPTRINPPSSSDDKVLFDWLRQRQVDSITLRDFLKYFSLMYSNSEKDKCEFSQAWQQIKDDICRDHPVLIGLERTKVESWYKIWQVAGIIKNHQVVVWGTTEKENGDVMLHLYDPKYPNLKDVTISFNIDSGQISWSPEIIGPIYAFFKTSYRPKTPPPFQELD